ncbi:hypothetical protein GW17_00027315 [Ensete ventricosum]|nr:hypothetical protein GW17_00027315 [Ensete ventricosum]
MLEAKRRTRPCGSTAFGRVPLLKDPETIERAFFRCYPLRTLQTLHVPPSFQQDYVFASRSKGIEASWPLAPQFLQLCLKHGVSDLLPPFEHPDIVRSRCLGEVEGSVQSAACSKPEKLAIHSYVLEPTDPVPSDGEPVSIQQESVSTLQELVLDCLDPIIHSSTKDAKSTFYEANKLSHSDVGIAVTAGTSQQAEEISSRIDILPCSVSQSRNSVKAQFQPEFSDLSHNLEKFGEPLEKNNRLVPQLGTVLEISHADHLVNNPGMIMHPVASKVCPVCKTFSFTSITTLNAHIDQCLSMGSNCEEVVNHVAKYKVKPRKKRLMVDIYAAAPCFTLEDLDKRNGTNWASELALIAAPINKVGTHGKRTEVSPTDSTPHGNGTVHDDSCGAKLSVLSIFNEQTSSLENFELRNHAKESKASMGLLASKKNNFAPEHLKSMNLEAQKEQLISFDMLPKQIQAAAEKDCRTESHQKNAKSRSHVSDSRDHDNSIAPAIIKQRARSKRSVILQKWTRKGNCSKLDDMIPIIRSTQIMSVQPDPGRSTDMNTQPLKLPRLSENMTGSPKTNRGSFLHNAVFSMDERKRESSELPSSSSRWPSKGAGSANGFILKLSRSSGHFTCSSIMKSNETNTGTQDHSDGASNRKMVSSKSCSMLRDQRSPTLKKNVMVKRPFCLEARKVRAIEKQSIFKKFHKHRTILRTDQKGLPPSNNAGVCSPTNNTHLLRQKVKRTLRSRQSCAPGSITKNGEGEVMNEVLPSRRNIREYSSIMEQQVNNCLKNMTSGAQSLDTEIETSGMQVAIVDSGDYVTKTSAEEDVCDLTAYDIVNSEKTEPRLSTQSDSCSCEEDAQAISESEAGAEQLKQICNEQHKFFGDGSSNEIGNHEIPMADVRGTKDYCAIQPIECHTASSSVQESSDCLTSHGDLGLELSEKGSSINSVRITASHIENLDSKGEPSGSSVSTVSAVSLPSPTDSKSQNFETEPTSRAISDQDNLHLATPSAGRTEATRDLNLENKKQEKRGSWPEKEPDQCLDDNRFFYSCKERLSRDSEVFRENSIARTTKLKCVPNFCVGARSSSSFGIYENHTSNAVVNSKTGPPNQLASAKSSPAPTCDSTCSPRPLPQTHLVSSPTLRLMGKNLVVVNHRDLVQPQTTALDCTQQVNLCSNGCTSTNNRLKQENFLYQHGQLSSGSPSFGPSLLMGDHRTSLNLHSTPVGGFAWTPLRNGYTAKPDQQTQRRNSDEKPKTSHSTVDKVIVINDSPKHQNDAKVSLSASAGTLPLTLSGLSPLPQTPVYCYPLQHQIRHYPRPLLPNVYSSASSSFMNQGIEKGSFVSSPTLFQFPIAQRGPSMCYKRNLH